MAGTWTSQNKILPGVYINFLTNAPLSIVLGDRGTVVLLQELSVGVAGEHHLITATDTSKYPEGITNDEKFLVNEALKNAREVLLYNLGENHTTEILEDALDFLKTYKFNTLAYPYSTLENKQAIVTWIKAMRDDEGIKSQVVLANQKADSEAVINVTDSLTLEGDKTITAEQLTAWVAGATAGANINQSLTGKKYVGAIDVVTKKTKSEMETAITNGEFIFKVDTAQNVTCVYDINSFTSVIVDKGKMFTKNRVVRVIDNINNDITIIFESNYVGKVNNNSTGRSLLRASLIEYFNELQRLGAIQNFVAEDVQVSPGKDIDAVVIDAYIQPVDSIEKIYITVNLA